VKVFVLEKTKNVLGLPCRVFNMPSRMLSKVIAVYVRIFFWIINAREPGLRGGYLARAVVKGIDRIHGRVHLVNEIFGIGAVSNEEASPGTI
jgi:hypothetical protein